MDTITDVPGVKVGHQEDRSAWTGCTAVLTEEGATAGVDVRGSAPGTRETDLLHPVNRVDKVHGICLTGGSAFGLDAASGVMAYLEEQGYGHETGFAKVPIVPAAVLYDLYLGDASVRPDRSMGYEAARTAGRGEFSFGNVGAGCGATVGKAAGSDRWMKGGLGSACVTLKKGLVVGALVAVNAVGDVRETETGRILAGPRDEETNLPVDSLKRMREQAEISGFPGTNTTLGVVAVNASFDKASMRKIAEMTHNGLARTIFPAHTSYDGDAIFSLATGDGSAPVDLVGAAGADVMAQAVVRAVKAADSAPGIPAWKEIMGDG